MNVLSITTSKPAPQYVGIFIVVAGVYTSNAMIVSWPGEFLSILAPTGRSPIIHCLQVKMCQHKQSE